MSSVPTAEELFAKPAVPQMPDGMWSPGLVIKSLSHVKARQQAYLWEGYLPSDQLIALYGPSHTAKSLIALDWAARITSGANWPDGTPNRIGPRKVLMLSAGEDALDTVLKPRFALADGDPSKLLFIESCRRLTYSGELIDDVVALDKDCDAVAQALDKDRSIGMIVVDPISNHLGALAMNKEEEVRPALMRLKATAEKFTVPIVIIGHFNKREKGTAALDRMMGARAFSGTSRTIYLTGPDNNSTEKHRYVLVQERGLGAKAWTYRTELAETTVDGARVKQVRLVWEGQTEATGQDVVDTLTGAEKSAEADSAEELKSYLSANGGSAPAEDCKKALGFPRLNWHRVREHAGVITERPKGVFPSKTLWKLNPDAQSVQPVSTVSTCDPVSVPTSQGIVSKYSVFTGLPSQYTQSVQKGVTGVQTADVPTAEQPHPVEGKCSLDGKPCFFDGRCKGCTRSPSHPRHRAFSCPTATA